ncbi:E3 ubiquitin-protein ligase RNF103-like [Tubulanus polymorphus]|uniref:E3 ubiquitin-protein ligase RNF103-like n=1 Tax=Tubulanus polymorphus TaxID=672921 RepID=UPI003DA65C9F
MWWKLLLLCIYAFVLFVLARMLEAFAWYESGYISSRFIDPWTLSVRKLKLLLDERGVSYRGVLERRELTELISASGDVMEGEVESSIQEEEDSTAVVSRNFTGETHFFEEVEDRKDSVWIIHVKGENHPPLLSDSDWNILIRKLKKFGVRSGMFDCSNDWRLCSRKNWYTSRVILALPQGFKAKDNITLKNYKGATKVSSIFDWINRNVASRIKTINDYNELKKDWFEFEKVRRKSELRVLFFTYIEPPPMFLSFLSVEFTGRAKFGTVNIHSREGKSILKRLVHKPPTYMVLTDKTNYTYASERADYASYNAMELYLKCLYPETNDVFIFSLILINLCCMLEFFVRQGGPFTRAWKLMLCLGKYNCVLLLFWLPTLGLLQFPRADRVIDNLLHYFRYISGSSMFSLIRTDILHPPLSLPSFALTFVLYGILVGIIEYKRTGGVEEDQNVGSDWWSGVWDDYTNYLFQPMASLTRPMSPQDLDLEEGMELLIERLAVPDLWLHPMISTDYIKDLPVWLYTGRHEPTSSDDFTSDTDGNESSGDSTDPQYPPAAVGERGAINLAGLSEASCVKLVMDGNYKCMCHSKEIENKSATNAKKNGTQSPESKVEVKKNSPTSNRNGSPPGMMYSTECVICLEAYKYGMALCGLPCGHSFHEQCILEWLSRDHHWCPLCRWPTYKPHPCKIRSHID